MEDGRLDLNIVNWTKFFWQQEATDWMLPLFWVLAKKYPACQVGEIGMRGGTSTMAWVLGVKESGGHVWSMDLDPCEEANGTLREFGLDKYHTFIQGNSTLHNFPAPLDILFIDGNHSYDGVKADFERHVKSLKDGGIVLFHDTQSWVECGDYVRELGGYCLQIGAGLGVLMPNGGKFVHGTAVSKENANQ